MIMTVNLKKLQASILYIASHKKVANLGLVKLYKLLYFVDTHHLREFGSTITNSEYIKYRHGPVPSRAERELKKLRRKKSVSVDQVNFHGKKLLEVKSLIDFEFDKFFSDDELSSLDFICSEYGRKKGKTLEKLSHDEPAWLCAQNMGKLEEELMYYGAKTDPDGL